ncbi:MAG: hypothetical protein AB7G13_13220 [Lautropia sp.]
MTEARLESTIDDDANGTPAAGARRRMLKAFAAAWPAVRTVPALAGITGAAAGVGGAAGVAALAAPALLTPRRLLAATPACGADRRAAATPRQTEGPYFTANSPRRDSLIEAGTTGTRLLLTGRVVDAECRPVGGALLDFWQADAEGAYDNQGFRLRGHLLADADGRYRLTTIVPGLYPGRTRHIHVKVLRPGQARGLTTQLYFPADAERNRRDGIYDPALLLRITGPAAGRAASASGAAGGAGSAGVADGAGAAVDQAATFDFVLAAG